MISAWLVMVTVILFFTGLYIKGRTLFTMIKRFVGSVAKRIAKWLWSKTGIVTFVIVLGLIGLLVPGVVWLIPAYLLSKLAFSYALRK